MERIGKNPGDKNPILWGTFILYLLVAATGLLHHELWGDEIHSWNIAKASGSFSDLISNTRYEGHPPVWYSILWLISKFSHDPSQMQVVHFLIAASVVFIIIFRSPFPPGCKIMIPFGYYFLYEYAALSRNYAIALLFAFILCIIIQKQKYSAPLLIPYYLFLFLLSNTHLIAMILAVSLHFYFLLNLREQKIKTTLLLKHLFAGALIMLPSVYFIFPPGDSSLHTGYWLNRWESHHISVMVQSPVKAFLPVPAWWEYHSWNTHFIITAISKFPVLKWITPLLSASMLFFILFMLKESKKAGLFFLFFTGLVFIAALIIPFSNARQTGFIFTGFLVAFWFYSKDFPVSGIKKIIISSILATHVIGAAIALQKDIRLPFSNGYLVNELIKKVPENEKLVTDYWCLNTLSAISHKAYYCIDLNREASFIQWNAEMKSMMQKENRYTEGIRNFFVKTGVRRIYMITIHPPAKIQQLDPALEKTFNLILTDRKEGAIERGSDLYLYEIRNSQ